LGYIEVTKVFCQKKKTHTVEGKNNLKINNYNKCVKYYGACIPSNTKIERNVAILLIRIVETYVSSGFSCHIATYNGRMQRFQI
jgi:hypothetical protein